jgi:copper chaperone CopZ
MKVKSILIFVLFLVTAVQSVAGIRWVDIGVNGLTCSMCSRSVEMSLRRLDFVDSVVMSLETTEGRVYLKEGSPIDFNSVPKAVVDAGFSVRYMKMQVNFDDILLNDDGSFQFQGQSFKWLDLQKRIKGQVTLKLVDPNFLPRKESAELKKKFAVIKEDQRILHVIQG